MNKNTKLTNSEQRWDQNKDMFTLMVNHGYCLICGNDATAHHHCIPKIMQPRHNIKIPICDNCHKMIHKILSFYKQDDLIFIKKNIEGKR